MALFYLYLTLLTQDELAELIQKNLPDYAVAGISDNMGFRAVGPEHAILFSIKSQENNGDEFIEMMRGMYDYFAAIPTEHVRVRDGLLCQIRLVNTAVSIQLENEDDELDMETFAAIADMADQANGLVFLTHGALHKGDGTLVLDAEGDSQLDEYPVRVPAAILDKHTEPTDSGRARKERSEALLREYGVPVNAGLPPIAGDENAKLREREEVVRRSIGIVMAAIYGELLRDNDIETAKEKGQAIIDSYDAWDCLSPEEQAFVLDDEPSDEDMSRYIWRYECYWAALWALGFVDELGHPDDICDVRRMVSFLREAGTVENFMRQAKLRDAGEILDQADLIYRLDWACVNAIINGKEPPTGLHPQVVMERHRFFNWLIRYLEQDWDRVRTDT